VNELLEACEDEQVGDFTDCIKDEFGTGTFDNPEGLTVGDILLLLQNFQNQDTPEVE
jgi:hypothetical protein